MSKITLVAVITLLVAGNVDGRDLKMSSDEKLVASTVNHLQIDSSILSAKPLNATHHTCIHYYSFLPCATNIPGFTFQIIVLEYLLLIGDRVLTKGRQQLFSILGIGIYGATLFRILAVLPNIVIILASGLAQNREAAKVRIENGAGMLAGSTVFCLTLQWGICVFFGRKNTTQEPPESTASKGTCLISKIVSSLKEYGVKTDPKTKITAGIMLISLIPFIPVEIASTFEPNPSSHIITLAIVCTTLVLYFFSQSRFQWIQERSLEYSRDQLLLAGFLDHLQKFAQKKLINDEGKLDLSTLKRAFHDIDKDKDNHISKKELGVFLRNLNSGDLEFDGESALEELMSHFDDDSNRFINEDEFKQGCEKIVHKAKEMVTDKSDSSRKYFPRLHKMVQPLIDKEKAKLAKIEQELSQILNTAQNQQLAFLLTDGKPDEAKIRNLFAEFDKDNNKHMTHHELKEMMKNKFGSAKFDHDDVVTKMVKVLDINKDEELHVDEFTNGITKRLSGDSHLIYECIEKEKTSIKKMSLWALTKSIVLIVLGVAIVSSLGLPLVNNTQLLSERIGIPPFYVSFVVLPFAVNFRTTMATTFSARQKKEDVVFSEIYGAVFMNNTVGLLTLVGLIWARGFVWNYLAEVVVLMVVSGIIGLIGLLRNVYPLWISILACSFYPSSLLLFYVIRFAIGWK